MTEPRKRKKSVSRRAWQVSLVAVVALYLIVTLGQFGSHSSQEVLAEGGGFGSSEFLTDLLDTVFERVPRGTRFAVLPITDPDGKSSYLGRYATDYVSSELADRLGDDYDLIDREWAEQVREIGRWAWGGEANAQTGPKLGELLVPSSIFTGTVFATDRDLVLSLRLIDIETGKVVAQESETTALSGEAQRIAAKDSVKGNPCLRAVARLLQENYKWLWAAILAPILAWLWQERATVLVWRKKKAPQHGRDEKNQSGFRPDEERKSEPSDLTE